MFVNTVETTRLNHFLSSLIANRHYCTSGNTTSKTRTDEQAQRSMDPENDVEPPL
jgi:hypothetical protein